MENSIIYSGSLKPTMVARRPYTFFSYVSAELGAQGVIAEKRRA